MAGVRYRYGVKDTRRRFFFVGLADRSAEACPVGAPVCVMRAYTPVGSAGFQDFQSWYCSGCWVCHRRATWTQS